METFETELKIFLVDDDPFCLNLYEQHLRNLGYQQLTTFENGATCLNALTQKPDIIFLDHSMDILTGVEVLKKIKRFNPDIYVVFISGQENVETAVSSLKYGAFDYIVKGENETRRMEETIKRIINVQRLLKKAAKSPLKKMISIFA